MKVLTCLVAIVVVCQSGWSQRSTSTVQAEHGHRSSANANAQNEMPPVTAEVQALRDQVVSQQQRLNQLEEDLKKRDTVLANMASKLDQLESSEVQATEQNNDAVTRLQGAVKDVETASTSVTSEIEDQQKRVGELVELQSKVKITTQFFGDFGFYTHTGFGPQFIAQMNQTGPFNAGFNTFDITRAYINVFFTPSEAITLRITPNVYRQIDGAGPDISGNSANNGSFAYASSADGNLAYRLKYGYIDFNTLFSKSKHFNKDKLTIGQTMQPFTDWEEGLNGYRYVYLTPWNYLTLSSTYVGVKLHGPIQSRGKEYLDYDLGVFNNASFHSIEYSDKKQGMARLTAYPFGTKDDRTGLGFTAFENYGYANKTPDTRSEVINRAAAIAFYQAPKKNYELGAEFDLGHNAMSNTNFFSGAGPADAFSSTTTTAYAPFNNLAKAILNSAHGRQEAYGAFGYYRVGESPFKLFGFYSYWLSNTNFGMRNPFDFERTVGGISYTVNKHTEFALQNSNLHYLHDFNSAQLANLNGFLHYTGTSALTGSILGAARGDTNGVFINVVYNY